MAREVEESEETEDASPASAAPAKPVRLLRYIPLVIIVLLLQALGAYFLIDRYWMRSDNANAVAGAEGERPRVIPESKVPQASVDMGEFVVNPRSTGANMLVTADVTLAVAPRDAAGEIKDKEKNDQVRDAIIYALTNATPEELGDREGRATVKDRMMRRINDALYKGQVVDIFFSKFIMQALPGYQEK